jgi:hypothetical protein
MIDRIADVINRYQYTHDEYPLARLILQAMREPTEAMIRSCDWPNTDRNSGLDDVWRVMIDAALSGSSVGPPGAFVAPVLDPAAVSDRANEERLPEPKNGGSR